MNAREAYNIAKQENERKYEDTIFNNIIRKLTSRIKKCSSKGLYLTSFNIEGNDSLVKDVADYYDDLGYKCYYEVTDYPDGRCVYYMTLDWNLKE